ncbi:MAG: hypothetical protein ACRDC6_16445 [Shewanella sp.]
MIDELRFKVNLNTVECESRQLSSIDDKGNGVVHFQYRSIERDCINGSIVSDTGWITSATMTHKPSYEDVTGRSMAKEICIAVSLASAFALAVMFILSRFW